MEMAVYGYTRVSTDQQADEGESLTTQERQIAGYALMLGLTIDRTLVEKGVSGSMPLADRPQGAALLAMVKAGDTIITPKLDRMFRSALDALAILGDLKERGIALHMIDLQGDVTSNGISKLVFTILAAVAEAERDRIRERIRDVKRDQKERGRYLGGVVRFGWRIVENEAGGKVMVEDPAQQAAIRRARELRAAGKSLRAIAAALAEDGIQVSHETIKQALAAQARAAA
jgi:DNA invertase Pin-like site-specific DNA recombinase